MRIIFGCLKDTFIKKLRSSYKMEFVRTSYNLRLTSQFLLLKALASVGQWRISFRFLLPR
jgi:hypothetical protein